MSDKPLVEVGAAWTKKTKGGDAYLSCKLKMALPADASVMIFKSKYADGDKPTHRLVSADVDEPTKQTTIDPAKDYTPNNSAPRTPDDIPF